MLSGKHGGRVATELEIWARAERQFIKDDIMWLRGGAKLISPSGDNINAMKLTELEARLEHVDKALSEIDDA
jgi:hypothetical protein